jgi:predicted ATPase/DNA-binding CsgD family transcriptional regulator
VAHQTPDEPGSVADANRYLERLAEVAGDARGVRDATTKAAALLEAQQVAAWGLRAAVSLARQSGLSWRELAAALDVPAATLHRQFQQGGGLFPPPGAPEPAPSRSPGGVLRGRRTAGSIPSRPLNLFVGRDRVLADLAALLPRRRLVTAWGPPGVGKTRLVLELTHQLVRRYSGGVFWVALAPLADAARVPAAVVAVMNPDERDRPLDETVAAACATGPVLLIVDNCEHLAEACADIVQELLDEHPKLTVVATSREALGIAGEARVRIDPLPVGVGDVHSPAVRLFTDRARDAVHDFQPGGNEDVIAEICTALDGLPLAIELAAQQCAVLPLTALRSTLARQLDLTVAGSRATVGPHTGLRTAIAWSYDLLDETERALFRRLSILPDGADQLSAAALAEGLELDRAEVWAILAGLAGASMLAIDESTPGRFRMLEALREFGREQLAAAGETDTVHELLLAWLTGRAQQLLASRARLKHLHQWAWDLAALESYRYAAALAGATADPRYATIATATVVLLNDTGRLQESRSLVGQVLAGPGLRPPDQVSALMSMVSALALGGDRLAALPHAEQAYGIALRLGDEGLLFQARSTLIYALGDHDPARSTELTRAQISAVQQTGDPGQLADPLNDRAWNLLSGGDIDEAQAVAGELLALRAGTSDSEELHTCGAIELTAGNVRRAAGHFSLGLARAVGRRRTLDQLEGLALVAAVCGEPTRALLLLGATAAWRDELNLPNHGWWADQIATALDTARNQLTPAEADAVAADGRVLTLDQLTRYARDGEIDVVPPPDTPLAPREIVIARLVATGHTTRQIAARLAIGTRTVDGHVARARARLGLSSRAQLAAWAAEHLG